MSRNWVGILLLVIAAILFGYFYTHLPPPGLERKGNGIVLWGINLNDLISLVGGIVSMVSGIVTLTAHFRKNKQ